MGHKNLKNVEVELRKITFLLIGFGPQLLPFQFQLSQKKIIKKPGPSVIKDSGNYSIRKLVRGLLFRR